jgi:hypothetical protein
VKRRFGDQALPLCLIIWSDGTALTQRLSAHPVVIKVCSPPPRDGQGRCIGGRGRGRGTQPPTPTCR